ncbi:ribose transport system substrate-binding protein [Aminobacter lissarensis]|uniref:Ribose transport system substrate-binding protein n=1 Tax=Aminobacter carboxidus TaxID=376165 RepID=A0A8E1WIM9_9HYPH|nr:sugar ABC transporter substrate-binding protein [Aminobacter lissarensis]MBB6469143.1 ribose transport system substrate-binding protein [Aminobacter lissarensis]
MTTVLKSTLAATICISAVVLGYPSFAADSTMKLGLSMPTLNTPFFTVLVNAATDEAKAAGGEVVQTTNANRDASQQVTDFRNLINAGANVILAGVVDRAAIKPALDYAKSKSVPVVIVDDKPSAGEVYAVVRADNVAMGARAAEALSAAMTQKDGTVLHITGGLTTTNGRNRKDGFVEAFTKVSTAKVIEQTANWDGPTSANVASTVMSGNADIAGIYLATDTLYYDPVSAALRSRGRLVPAGETGHIAMVAIDGGASALKAIRDGYLDATISQPVTDYAKYGVVYLQAALDGKEMTEGPTDHDSTVVKDGAYFVDELPSPIVTKTNVDDANLWGNAK